MKTRTRRAALRLAGLGAFLVLLGALSLVLPRFRRGGREIGRASWYGGRFHGRTTASGDLFNMLDFTAASPVLPLGTILRVTNPANEKSILVLVNDRGPYAVDSRGQVRRPLRPHPRRNLDLSFGAARELGIVKQGVATVYYEVLVNRSNAWIVE